MDSHRQFLIAVAVLFTLSVTDGCTFGEGCMYPCHCEGSEPCDPEDGSCPSSCDDGDLGEPGDLLTQGPWSGYGCQIGNVAYRKLATQGPDTYREYSADRAVDGNHEQTMGQGSCAHPHGDMGSISWWQVDLVQNYVISRVNITNRNANRNRLPGTHIYVRSSMATEDDNTLCYDIPHTIGNVDYINAICTSPVLGQYVRLQRAEWSYQSYTMNICEVQVYGYPYQDCLGTHFGIACATPCNCVLDCDSISARCPENACQDGWMEDTCQTPFPVNITSVDILNITSTSVVVQFHSYTTPEHVEQMEYYYLIDWREADGSIWSNESYVQHSERLDVYEILVGGLESGVAYYLRLTPYRETPTAVYRGVPVETGPHRALSVDGPSDVGGNIVIIVPVVLIAIIILAAVVALVYVKRKRIFKKLSQNGILRSSVSAKTEINLTADSTRAVEMGNVYENVADPENNNRPERVVKPPGIVTVLLQKVGRQDKYPHSSKEAKKKGKASVPSHTDEPHGSDNCAYQNLTYPAPASDALGRGTGDVTAVKTNVQGPGHTELHVVPLSRDGEEDTPALADDDHEYGNQVFVGRPIKVHAFAKFMKEMERHPGTFKGEFDMLPKGQKAKWDVGAQEKNASRNRFENIMAYDHSRVILEPTSNEDESTDYINANYIQAYRDNERGYIATQGPRDSTIEDMWQMVWQTNANRIVMLTKLLEEGKVKCEQYWPEENTMVFGPFQIIPIKAEKYADYAIRTISLAHKSAKSRLVYQLHFTGWPDKTAPEISTSLLEFRRRVHEKDEVASGPLIVHCSAGVGRTGTFLAIDYLIQQAAAEGEIDLFRYAGLMRNSRISMIQNLGQYVFIYETLLEHVLCGTTAMAAFVIKARLSELLHIGSEGTSGLDKQFQLLQSLASPDHVVENSVALTDENAKKNRTNHVLPSNRCRPLLITNMPGTTNYINAAYVDGYYEKQAYLVTQLPLPNTVCDVWRLLYDHHCKTLVLLHGIDEQDETTPLYWPTETSEPLKLPPLVITMQSTEEEKAFYIRNFEITHEGKPEGKSRTVRLYEYRDWEQDSDVPSSTSSLLALLDHLQRWQQKSGNHPVTAQCKSGYTHSGLFLAASYMLEKLRLNHEVDVFQAVKQIRRSRPQLVTSLGQYRYLHELAIDYISTNEDYENFK